ncbi:tuliposide A-converting enzyme 2, chloroplastic-like [Panicum miliaceum]|uniref:Tuliposide A-converting enzyme 2, chloroplastic-like n=1 Tax=Panicum miliaceum TaxID=4540 RepID=A0A3L6TIY6_PANMI|nr:tuliposide A-converting enzyme 2, chloroplastic-like [Panicum miliaceum]
MDPSSEVILQLPMFRIYKDLHVDRLVGTETVPAGTDAATGVVSKDVVIDDDSGVYVRLYLPDIPDTRPNDDDGRPKKLRVLVFFHGGGFITESAASPMYHGYVNSLAATAGVLVVSVNYRLAPEHPFPVGYEDSFRALKWALSGADPWLSRHGDLGRVFLAGDSAGGNIVHNVAMMAVAAGPDVAGRIEGAVLLHAAFGGKEPVAGESVETAGMMGTLWGVICPEATDGVDDPRINPLAAAGPSLRGLPFERLLVVEADGDLFRARGRAYYEGVVASGWGGKVEWFESVGKEHVFFLFEPGCPEAVALMDRLVAFFAGN